MIEQKGKDSTPPLIQGVDIPREEAKTVNNFILLKYKFFRYTAGNAI